MEQFQEHEGITAIHSDSIFKQYLFFHNYCKENKDFGSNSLVVMMVGDFYEIYGNEEEGADVVRVAEILDHETMNKNGFIGVGFNRRTFDLCVSELLAAGYSPVVQVDEVEKSLEKTINKTKQTRRLIRPITKGTMTLSGDSDNSKGGKKIRKEYGIISHIFFREMPVTKEGFKPLTIAISTINVGNGECELYEVSNDISDPNYALDQVKRCLLQMRSAETLVSSNISDVSSYLKYLNLPEAVVKDCVEKEYFKVSYQRQALSKLYPNTAPLTPIQYMGLERNPCSIISFLLLVQHLYERWRPLINCLQKPTILTDYNNVILSNNAIIQLNILTDDTSLFDILNECSTPMGTRLLRYHLCHPIVSVNKLRERYNKVEYMRKDNLWKNIEETISKIPDLDKIIRRIEMGIISPAMLVRFVESYDHIRKLFSLLSKSWHEDIDTLENETTSFLEFIRVINIDVAKISTSINNIKENLFIEGKNKTMDHLHSVITENRAMQQAICDHLSHLVDPEYKGKSGKKLSKKDQLVSIKEEKTIFMLTATKSYFIPLEISLTRAPIIFSIGDRNFEMNINDISQIGDTKSRKNFTFPCVSKLSEEYFQTIDEFTKRTKPEYISFLKECSIKYSSLMHRISRTIAEIDFYKALAKVSIKRNYCRPEADESESAFIEGKTLRHPIIESILSEPYVPHDVFLGSSSNNSMDIKPIHGNLMLLYGTNTCGKSTLMRTLGNIVIMAQIGSFVPAEYFRFSPVNAIYTRILTEDDIKEGKSSFKCETMELAPILRRSNNKSLILGDELSHSTTHLDATSIVTSSIVKIIKNGSIGVLTTHDHRLAKMEELSGPIASGKLTIYHLAMRIENKIVKYDRHLTPGSGPDKYGIEIAEVCDIPEDVIEQAYKIRRKLCDEDEHFLSFKKSRYNSNVFMDICQVCKKNPAKETHHILPQCEADENGFIGHIPIHSEGNLKPLCHGCHADITYAK